MGVNNGANGGFLLWLFIPGLWTVLLLVWVAVGALLGNRPLLRSSALAVTLLGVVWCVTSVFWGYATPLCPAATPRWWPSLLLTPGF